MGCDCQAVCDKKNVKLAKSSTSLQIHNEQAAQVFHLVSKGFQTMEEASAVREGRVRPVPPAGVLSVHKEVDTRLAKCSHMVD